MPRRETPLLAGYHYHIYNRGHNGEPIFFAEANYIYFLRQIRKYIMAEHGSVIAYALMPNHYHLLLRAETDQLSSAMQRLGISYTKAINKAFARTGSLFQGAFQARLVECNEYLLHFSRYIHLNPVHGGLVSRPEAWVYSSYQDYLGLRHGTMPQPQVVLDQFQARGDYRCFVQAYLPDDREATAKMLFD
jgi:REP element-mobilizing transposase RayT